MKPDTQLYKQMARRLKPALGSAGKDLAHIDTLEWVAVTLGFKTWEALYSMLAQEGQKGGFALRSPSLPASVEDLRCVSPQATELFLTGSDEHLMVFLRVYEQQAFNLQAKLKAAGRLRALPVCLKAVAQMHGFPNWKGLSEAATQQILAVRGESRAVQLSDPIPDDKVYLQSEGAIHVFDGRVARETVLKLGRRGVLRDLLWLVRHDDMIRSSVRLLTVEEGERLHQRALDASRVGP